MSGYKIRVPYIYMYSRGAYWLTDFRGWNILVADIQ